MTHQNSKRGPRAKYRGFGMVYVEQLIQVGQELGPTGVAVWVGILSFVKHETGVAFPKVETLRKRIGVSRSTVFKYLNELEGMGLLVRRSGKQAGRANKYWVHVGVRKMDTPELEGVGETDTPTRERDTGVRKTATSHPQGGHITEVHNREINRTWNRISHQLENRLTPTTYRDHIRALRCTSVTPVLSLVGRSREHAEWVAHRLSRIILEEAKATVSGIEGVEIWDGRIGQRESSPVCAPR